MVQAEAFDRQGRTFSDRTMGKKVEVSNPTPGWEITYNRITIDPGWFPNWQNWEGAEVHIFPAEDWVNAILPVTSVDKLSSTLYVNSTHEFRPGNRFFIANVREALDSPGEWYLDKKTGELLYWPTEPDFPNNVEVVAPTMDRLIVLQGDMQNESFVEHIYFQGLTFTDTDYTLADNYYFPADAAIWLSAARQCGISDCTFVRLSGYGVRMEQGYMSPAEVGTALLTIASSGCPDTVYLSSQWILTIIPTTTS